MKRIFVYRSVWPRTLFTKISTVFWLFLLALAAAQYLLLTYYWQHAVDTLLQRLHWGLAQTLSEELVARTEGIELSAEVIRKELRRLEELQPFIDIYILDAAGHIEFSAVTVASREDLRVQRVDRSIIERFMESGELDTLPVYGPNPIYGDLKDIFSAADFELDGKAKTLYVCIFGRRLHVLIDSIEVRYFSVGGGIALTAMLLFTALMAFSAFFLVTRRFRSMVQAVHQFYTGDMNARVPVSGSDELAVLGSEINAMADMAVQNLAEVQQLDSSRRRMVAMISHDLGAPIRAVQSELQRAQSFLGADTGKPSNSSLENAQKSVAILLSHIDELFELSKIETDELRPDFQVFSLLDVITEELLPRFNALAEDAGVSIEVVYRETSMYLVRADAAMIERVMSNLLQNAIRYNLPGGSVTVELREEEERVAVSLSDTGRGIPEAELDLIFEPFKRSSEVLADGAGSGLGLAIVKQLLRVHHEDIFVESKLGAGTTFRFSLTRAG